MTQKQLIARAGQGLLDLFKLLLSSVSTLCAAIGSLLLTAMSHYEPEETNSEHGEAMADGLSPMEREEVARVEGWKSW